MFTYSAPREVTLVTQALVVDRRDAGTLVLVSAGLKAAALAGVLRGIEVVRRRAAAQRDHHVVEVRREAGVAAVGLADVYREERDRRPRRHGREGQWAQRAAGTGR